MNKRTVRLTELELNNIITESVKTIISELDYKTNLNKESFDESNYTHFAVNKKTNLIVNGWDYSDYDNSELRAYANDYFWDDMRDNEFNPKDYRILSRKGCLKLGINPNDMDNCWSNRGEIPCAQERMNK